MSRMLSHRAPRRNPSLWEFPHGLVVLGSGRTDEGKRWSELGERAILVRAHESAISGHIGGNDRCQSALDGGWSIDPALGVHPARSTACATKGNESRRSGLQGAPPARSKAESAALISAPSASRSAPDKRCALPPVQAS